MSKIRQKYDQSSGLSSKEQLIVSQTKNRIHKKFELWEQQIVVIKRFNNTFNTPSKLVNGNRNIRLPATAQPSLFSAKKIDFSDNLN